MRLLIIGMLEGHISTAGQIAISRGATVSQVDSIDAGLHSMREGRGADLVMIDIKLPIAKLMKSMKGERLNTPVVACGVSNDPDAAVAAIKAGAKEYGFKEEDVIIYKIGEIGSLKKLLDYN